MTDEQLQRIHDIEYSCDSREELAERIVGLEDELTKWERLTAGIELPEYPITQFQPKDLERENAELREQIEHLQPKDCEGNALDIADTVSMLRSEYDGDHEWDDVVVELTLTKWGGDRWIVRGSKGEAWACDCTKTGYDEDAFEDSGDVEPFDDATLADVENAKLRDLVAKYSAAAKYLCGHSHCNECNLDCASVFDDVPSGWDCARMLLDKRARELGIEVDG